MVDGVRERFELVDDMEVRDKCWNEDVDGVDGVVWRELENDDVLVTDIWCREMTGVVGGGGWGTWGGNCTGEWGVEMCGSVSEAAKDGVNGDGEWLEAGPEGGKVNTEGCVLRDMNMGGGFWRDFAFGFGCDCEHDVIAQSKVNEMRESIVNKCMMK